MNQLFDLIKKMWERLINYIWEPGHHEFWGIVMSSVVIAIIAFVWKRILRVIKIGSRFSEKQFLIPKLLQNYKKSVDEETLTLKHSWKLEEQTLKELIVPVTIYEKEEAERQNLDVYIKSKFKNNDCIRLLILGDAGSGKSVAMGYMARTLWTVKREKVLLPVLLSFSEIKEVKTEADFEKVIIDNLERHQFGLGRKSQKAVTYIEEHLNEGDILLIIDGLDELEKTTRFEIANFIDNYFQKYQQIPFVISSRIAVWKQNPNILPNLHFDTVHMADFTPFEIRQFVSQWKFDGNKSSDQLADIINSKAYLKAIAVNPLILTILTFLYAQPKRVLPDNRVKFYAECIDALMEKWDNARALNRANQFETIDKVTILSHVAYEHITDSRTTDEDIPKTRVLSIIGDVMKTLSRPVEKREKMLTEIAQNAELLIELPPDGYKFPHRTFMEYFAANYFYEEKKYEELLKLYEQDKGKWQETLALFCGLNLNSEVSDIILNQLKEDFISTQSNPEPDVFVFKALVESARISEKLANEILDLAKSYLDSEINPNIIECLGYIAVNPNWEHHEKAKQILLGLLSHSLSEQDLQQVIFALVNLKEPQIRTTILRHLNDINISAFLLKIGKDAEGYAIKLLENIPDEKLPEIFNGLKGAGALEFLFSLMINSNRETIKQNAAWALASTSKSELFFKFIDTTNLRDLSLNIKDQIEYKYRKYTWPYDQPETANGKNGLFFICYYCTEYIINNINNIANNFSYKENNDINNRLKYLISAFLNEKGYNFSKYNLVGNSLMGSEKGIIAHWKCKNSDYDPGIGISFIILYIIVNISGMFQYWKLSIILDIFGIMTFIDIGAFTIYFVLNNMAERKRVNKKYPDFFFSSAVIGVLLCTPCLLTLLLFVNISKYKLYYYIFYGIIITTLIIFLPIPYHYKLFYSISTVIASIFLMLKSFINPLGWIFINNDIKAFLFSK